MQRKRRSQSGVVNIAALFRVDTGGTFVGSTQPSVVGPGEDGSVFELSVTNRNDVIAYGYSGTEDKARTVDQACYDRKQLWRCRIQANNESQRDLCRRLQREHT